MDCYVIFGKVKIPVENAAMAKKIIDFGFNVIREQGKSTMPDVRVDAEEARKKYREQRVTKVKEMSKAGMVVADIAKKLDISEMTVKRDLER